MTKKLDKILEDKPEIKVIEFLRGWGAAIDPLQRNYTPLYVGYIPTNDGKLIVLEMGQGLYAGQWNYEYVKVYDRGEEQKAKLFSKRRLRSLLSKCVSEKSGKIESLVVPRKYHFISPFESKDSDGKRCPIRIKVER